MPELLDPEHWRIVLELYERAADLPSHERLPFLSSTSVSSIVVEEVLQLFNEQEPLHQKLGSDPEESHKNPLWPRLGQRFGRFEVTRALGRGGMSEVYSAVDTDLGRIVAIKFLKAGHSGSWKQLAREARTASALNHINIVTIHEVTQVQDDIAVIMELVEGSSLRNLCHGLLPLAQFLQIGIQVSRALFAAHASGIVHRDVKPENVIVRPDGCVKVLDFGLARWINAENPAPDWLTSPGLLVGTWRYMSPEQVKGKLVNGATDIFSLGLLLYELATGKHPFEAGSAFETMQRAVTSQPEAPSRLRVGLPRSLDKLLLSMLSKDPQTRPDAQTVVTQLEAVSQFLGSKLHWHTTMEGPSRKTILRLLLLGSFLLCFFIMIALERSPRYTARFHLDATAPSSMSSNYRVIPFSNLDRSDTDPSFSPDGSKIAFVANNRESHADPAILVKPVGPGNVRRLTDGTGEEANPVWSPDGTQIAFFRYPRGEHNPEVMLVPAQGGSQQTIAKVNDRRISRSTLTWLPNGDGLVVSDSMSADTPKSLALFRLLLNGAKQTITSPPSIQSDFEPTFSPDGRWMAFLRGSYADYSNIWIMPSSGGMARPVTSGSNVISTVAWAPNSRELIFALGSGGLWRISVFGGSPKSLLNTEGETQGLTVARHGNRLAYVRNFESLNIWNFSLSKTRSSLPVKLISSARDDFEPAFSPDGFRIVFSSDRSGAYQIWICQSDGTNARQLTSFDDSLVGSPAWSPDGQKIAFDARVKGNADIYVLDLLTEKLSRLTDSPSSDVVPAWSWDGAWIYFCSNRGGEKDIWKVPASGGPARQVTTKGGFEGRETPDGKFLYYTKDTTIAGMWRIPVDGNTEQFIPELQAVYRFRYWDLTRFGIYFVDSEPTPVLRLYEFRTGRVRTLISLPKPPGDSFRGLAIRPDGKSLLYSQYDLALRQILLVENFLLGPS